jgi:hypothetical protein
LYKAKEHFKSAKWATAMRILIFNWRDIKNPEAGGAEVHLHEVFRRIAPRAEVTLVSCRFKGCQKSETIDGIKVIRVGNRFLFNFAAFWHFVTRLKDDGFDIIVDDVSKVPLFTPLYREVDAHILQKDSLRGWVQKYGGRIDRHGDTWIQYCKYPLRCKP